MAALLDFLKNYFAFMLILFLFSYLTPREEYRKYMLFFIGMLMVGILIRPFLDRVNDGTAERIYGEVWRVEKELGKIEYEKKGEDIYERFLENKGLGEEADKKEE